MCLYNELVQPRLLSPHPRAVLMLLSPEAYLVLHGDLPRQSQQLHQDDP